MLAQMASCMSTEKSKKITRALIDSQFGYCPLIWMFHGLKSNNRINYLHERALRLVYKDSHMRSFCGNIVPSHAMKFLVQKLATEMFITSYGEENLAQIM